ncbi:hypothetical protein T190_04275 [Sinorhizobium meliloti CCBAU 01290]|nr:hypothetical protein T190_04275 [Sinorhizobium meliloti CCBAU 01290]
MEEMRMQPDERYVIGMDSSTQSVKAVAWTADGTPRAEGRAPHRISTPHPHKAEQDAEDWWSAACQALSSLMSQIDADRVDGIAISNQRETMVLLGEDRKPLAPATVWLDRRAQDVVQRWPMNSAASGCMRFRASGRRHSLRLSPSLLSPTRAGTSGPRGADPERSRFPDSKADG